MINGIENLNKKEEKNMANFRMVLLGKEKTEIKSKAVNKDKLDWFLKEVQKHQQVIMSDCFIKIYISDRKVEHFIFKESLIDELSLLWINYKKNSTV